MNFQSRKNIKLGINAYLVHALGMTPELGQNENQIYSEVVPILQENEKSIFNFKFPIPEKVTSEESIWIQANLYENEKLFNETSGLVKLSQIADLVLEKNTISLKPLEEKNIKLFIFNYSDKAISGKIICEGPSDFMIKNEIPVSVKANKKSEINVVIKLPEKLNKDTYYVNFRLFLDKKEITDEQLKLVIKSEGYVVDLDPINTLCLNQKNRINLVIKDLPEIYSKSKIDIMIPSNWEIADFKNFDGIDFSKSRFINIPFSVIPKMLKEDFITVKIISGNNILQYKEKFKSFQANESCVLLSDVNHDQIDDVVMANKYVEIVATPIIGGRILKIIQRESGNNLLFVDYPGIQRTEGNYWQSWAEYGGLNDWWPSGWPGDVWNNMWNYTIKEKGPDRISVDFNSEGMDGKLLIKRTINLNKDKNFMEFYYQFKNLTDSNIPFFYNSHPDLAPGLSNMAELSDSLILPIIENNQKKKINIPFLKNLKKQSYAPAENWSIAMNTVDNEYLGQIFELDKVRLIGIWQGINFFSMELLSQDFMLGPYEQKDFRYYYFVGNSDWQKDLENVKAELQLP